MSIRVPVSFLLIAIFAAPVLGREKPWIEVRSPHFRILTNGGANDARHVAQEFEQMRYVFQERNPMFRLEGGAPLTVFAAADEATAKVLEPFTWKAKGAKPAGIYHHAWEREYVMMRLDDWNLGAHDIVYHEYAHSILHRNLHWIPVWLDEGMADYYGFTRFEGSKIYVGAPSERYRMLSAAPLIPIETLISVDRSSPYYHNEDKVYLFYAESWGLVHFLIFGPDMEKGQRLNQFSALLQQGVEQKKAFQQVFGDFKKLDSELQKYVSQFAFQVGVLTNPPNINAKDFVSRPLTIAETDAELAGFHLWTHDFADAETLAGEAIKDDPKLGFAHEVMGFADFEKGKDSEAFAEFSQACSLDPTLYLSLFAKTMMSPIATSSDPADEEAFHSALLQVLKINPQFAPPFVQLAKLDLREGDPISALAVSRKAEQLEPTRAGYHVLSGQILRDMGKDGDAGAFARFVAERWPGSDHNEAVELWNSIPAPQRPAGDPLSDEAPKDSLSVDGHIRSLVCGEKNPAVELLLTATDGKTLTLRSKGAFTGGFSDTIWYGEDHFSYCHHLEGMRAVVRYKAPSEPSYSGDILEIDIRDDIPSPPKVSTATAGH